MNRKPAKWGLVALVLGLQSAAMPVWASCFDRTIAVSRYTFLDPTDLSRIYQDIYRINLSGLPPSTVVRLSVGEMSNVAATTTGGEFKLYSTYSDDGRYIGLVEEYGIATVGRFFWLAPQVSSDGQCLAYLARDMAIPYGPNEDLCIRDLQSGETRRITSSRDVSDMAWQS